jgi:hypothetical protein
MAAASDTIKQLTAALEGLLTIEDTNGDHSYCQVCEEVDGHTDRCAVGSAERVLRLVRPKS